MSRIQITNLTFSYDTSFDPIFEDVSFQIDTDWKLGFIGRNGRGKTTFLNLLLGKYDYSGTISASVDFEYFPYPVEHPEEMTLSIIEDVNPLAENWQICKELNLLDADPEILYRPFSSLSNGERTKVLLAALFLKENAFLLIDEPTNHLDIRAREKVARYLSSKSGFILVSHDRAFLDECIDHVLSINKADIEIQKGTFSSWFANKEAQDKMELERNVQLKQDIRRLEEASRRTERWSDKI
ncbi:ATP-binding cassette domain-containing protein, partial [Faecalicatena contorta]|uniref:ATP-binding cassette domain-containing protein n=1 Tax=Faecalicatena contorta TaxID=39482 RepID=UPI003217E628